VVKVSHKEAINALLGQSWIYALTMPDNPHEYCLRKNWSAETSFDDVVLFIRQNGYEAVFGQRAYTYFHFDGYQYWTMGFPVCDTTLINRAKLTGLEIIVEGPYGWPKFEGSLPPLPPVRGVYLLTFEHRDGFLPYSVGITRRPMRMRFLEHRRKYVSGDYNVLEVNAGQQGTRSLFWKGWNWAPERRAAFDATKSDIVGKAERQMEATSIFTMNIGTSPRLPERIEGAIANHFYQRNDTLFDQGMLRMPRWSSEEPIIAAFHCKSALYGLPSQLEI
jgi:hypothetical protein